MDQWEQPPAPQPDPQPEPRPEPRRSRAVERPTPLSTLLASARRLTGSDVAKAGRTKRKKSAEKDWQDTAREMYRSVGEYQFIVDTISGKVGQARLFVGKISPEDPSNDPEPVTDEEAVIDVLNSLGGTYAGRSQLLKRLAVNLMVVGDGWICGIPNHIVDPDSYPKPKTGEEIPLADLQWRFLSIKEVEVSSSKVKLRLDNINQPVEVSPDQVYLIRVWDPDPFEWWEAAASSRANLPVLKELVGLTMHISAQVDSRLAGAGVFLVPQSAQQALRAAAGVEEGTVTDEFTEALIEAMLTPMADRGSASAIVPLVITAPDDSIDKFRHITFSSELDAEARELREEAIRRLALGMDAPPEVLLGTSGANHWGCVDPDTEILTRWGGWIRHEDLVEGTEVLTLDHETGRAEWQPIETVHRYSVVDAPMLQLDSLAHQSWTTLNHRWPVTLSDGTREWLTSEELEPGQSVTVSAAGAAADVPTYSNALVELAAWFAMSGYVSDFEKPKARFMQSYRLNPAGVDRIRTALLAEYGPDGFREVVEGSLGSHTGRVTSFHLPKSHTRVFLRTVLAPDTLPGSRIVSPEFLARLTQAQLELFIDTCAAANVRHERHADSVDAWLGNPWQLEAFALAGTLAGYSVTWVPAPPTPAGGSPGDWCVSLSRVETVEPLAGEVSVGQYTGVIWCPQVPNRTWLARRGRRVFFTGNSWMVSADVIASHVEPKLALICDALTTQYLWPVLEQQDVENAQEYVVWYDVAHLISQPNRSQDALALHDKKVISDATLRRELGFDEDDAPEEKDPVADLILQMAQSNPGMLRSPALPQMVEALQAIVDGNWAALAAQSEEEPEPPAAAPEAAPAEAAAGPTAEPTAEAPPGELGAAEPEPAPNNGAPRLPMTTALPIQGVQTAPVG